ncbi:hypothetical protein [Bradyrhizobium sp. BWC-3-1]|uniref:hypothetical protein n=1 Tax=Bradyrhizobium sp. BWC-3-1 TaxID=3080012 RepID=UPI00293F6C9B|nr:hypothetical protein [Bradyrhizobium sp. BWC-3-1]WOH58524.1 hypothetical protein RX329_41670 [Bradyrhizobium sp. BWC-3-1]
MLKQIGWCSRRHGEPHSPLFQMPDGSRCPGEFLQRPEQPHYSTLPGALRKSPLVETWIDVALHTRSWPDRAVAFDQLIRELLDSDNEMSDSVQAVRGLLTLAAEHLCERELTTLDAAQFYRPTLHEQWRAVGSRFIRCHRITEVRTWLKLHPGFDRVSKVSA